MDRLPHIDAHERLLGDPRGRAVPILDAWHALT